MRVPRDWLQGDLGLGAPIVSAIDVPPCQEFQMSWTMATPGDTPANYLPSPAWNVFVFSDPSDKTGATYTINGSYTGSASGAPGSASSVGYSLESTAQYTVKSFSVAGQATAGACASAPPPAPTPPSGGSGSGGSAPVTPAPVATGTATYVAAGVGVVGVGAAIWYFFLR
jgi:hypothetical protein